MRNTWMRPPPFTATDPTLVAIFSRQDAYGITNLHLAEVAGVSRVAISHWRNGRNLPRLDTLYLLAEAVGLRVKLEDL